MLAHLNPTYAGRQAMSDSRIDEVVTAYLKGFQGEVFGPESVSTVTKHFPGAGPMEDGEDSHFVYGKNQ